MKIELKEISIREICEGYKNHIEDGVEGYGGLLNIRPAYQREFVYKDKQRDEVIRTVKKNFPLNVMYWVKNTSPDGKVTYEVLDGQQRTISICDYVDGKYSINFQYFHNLTEQEQEDIYNYKLMIYVCEGSDKDKLEWFKTINISGEKLTEQELRNAMYTGTWLYDAKRYFSRRSCTAYQMGGNYLSGNSIRQDYLETVLSWISNGNIEEYMAKHQHDTDANELWMYFQEVVSWLMRVFPTARKEMKSVQWGELYNEYKGKSFNSSQLEKEVKELMIDDDVTKKSGIYYFLVTGDEKYLSIRAFSEKQKREAFELQNGVCVSCKNTFEINEMEGDHITPWSEGGKTSPENLQMLCKNCNRRKSSS